MIRHVVLIRFRDDSPETAIDDLVAGLKALPPKVPEIKSYEVGVDIAHGQNSAQVCLVSDFEDMDALERYRIHPDHREVVDRLILPYLNEITAADYER